MSQEGTDSHPYFRFRKKLPRAAVITAAVLLAAWVLLSLVVEPLTENAVRRSLHRHSGGTLTERGMSVDLQPLRGQLLVRNLELRSAAADSAGGGSGRSSPSHFLLRCERLLVGQFGIGGLLFGPPLTAAGILGERELELHCNSLRWEPDGKPYRLNIAAIRYRSGGSVLEADSLRITPLLPPYEFARQAGHEVDRIDATISRLAISGLDRTEFFLRGAFRAASLLLTGGNIAIFRDRRMPAGPPLLRGLPHLALSRMDHSLDVDSLLARELDISYSEHKNRADRPGKVFFRNTHLDIAPLSNTVEEEMQLNARTRFMGKAPLQVRMKFHVNDTSGFHTIDGSMGPLRVADFNPVIENLAFIRARSGILHSLWFSMELNRRESRGTVLLDYENLNLAVLDPGDPARESERMLKSLLLNTFMVKRNNHGTPLRRGEVGFRRVENKSVFNYWWKSLLSGLTDNIGL